MSKVWLSVVLGAVGLLGIPGMSAARGMPSRMPGGFRPGFRSTFTPGFRSTFTPGFRPMFTPGFQGGFGNSMFSPRF